MTTEVAYNPAYSGYFQTDARHALLYGGRGSGKSVAIFQKHLMRALRTPGYRHLTIRKVLKSCRHSTFQGYRDLLMKMRIEAAVNRVEMGITFPNGAEILHAGLDDPMKLLSIVGIDSIHIEEADQVSEDEFEEVDVLMRGMPRDKYFQTTMSFNPRRGKYWARSRFVENPESKAFVLHTTWRDNLFVGKDYGKRLEAIADPNKRAIYAEGEWGQDVRGLIYPEYLVLPAPSGPPDAYGLDFGFVHPTALVAIWDRDPYLHVQQIIHAPGLINPSSRLREAMESESVDPEIPIYCDHAMPGLISEIQSWGYRAEKADKAVEDGIATVKRFKLAFTPDSQDLIDEADGYTWQETRDGSLKQQPVKVGDDLLDATRYAAHTHIGKNSTWGVW